MNHRELTGLCFDFVGQQAMSLARSGFDWKGLVNFKLEEWLRTYH